MKILLIYPEYPATFWSFKHALPFVNKKVSLLIKPNLISEAVMYSIYGYHYRTVLFSNLKLEK